MKKVKFKKEVKRLQSMLIETTTDVRTINIHGEKIILHNIPALKDEKSNKIYVDPADVSMGEIKQLAEENNIEARDIPLLLLLCAVPGPFKKGEIHYQYHLNKMLFYLQKNLEKNNYNKAFPHDEFIAADRGPVPEHIDEDLEKLQEQSLITIKYRRWGSREKDQSKNISLTKHGITVANLLWDRIGEIFKEEILRIKNDIFPLDPETVKKNVHEEFPEYKKSYKKEDYD